jgi:hypothetical protein
MPALDFKVEFHYYLRPTVPVRLAYGDRSIETDALLDTGSEFTVLDEEFAHVLGLDLTGPPTQRMHGISGGIIEAPVRKLTLSVLEDGELRALEIDAAFVPNLHQRVGNILGRRDFFQAFKLGLVHSEARAFLG